MPHARLAWIAGLAAGVVAAPGFAPAALAAGPSALASPPPEESPEDAGPDVPAPDVAPAVTRLLNAPYLSDEEKKDLRVFHGLWEAADLDTPGRRARAALTVGAYDHPALSDPQAPPLDRAEAMVRRGELREALALLDGAADEAGRMRAVRLRAEALHLLGRHAEAAEAVGPAVARLSREQASDPEEVAEAVRALLIRTRVLGSSDEQGSDYNLLLWLLSVARQEMSRLSWPVRLAEAELLYSQGQGGEAQAAAIETLTLNPRAAGAIALMGELAVDRFDSGTAGQAATILRELQNELPPGEGWEPGVSLDAALVEGRSWLREREPERGEAIARAALERFPHSPRLLALEAAIAAGSYRFSRVRELLEAYEERFPGSALGHFAVGNALGEARQYEAAAGHLAEARVREPNWAEPSLELGLLLAQAGRDAEAERPLADAVRQNPFHVRARNSLKLVRELQTFETIETEHFVIRYRDGIDEVLAREMPPLLDGMFAAVTGSPDDPGTPYGIDHVPERKTIIELMPSHEWFSVRITGMPRIWTVAAATGPIVAFESPQEGPGFSAGPYDWLRVMRHEFTHTVTLSRSRNRIAHWMTEAAAVQLEDAPRDYQRWTLLTQAWNEGRLFDLRTINTAFVRPERPSDRSLAYAQGQWMYEFILDEWGARAPLEIMDLMAEGQPIGPALERVLGVTGDEFLSRFRGYAREQLVAAGMILPEGTPTVADLLRAAGKEPQRATMADLEALAEEHPGHPDLLDRLVRMKLARRSGSPTEDMIPLLEAYAAARPVDDLPHRMLAKLHLDRGDPESLEAAIPHLEFLDVREVHSAGYAAELTERYAAIGDLENALAKAERTTRIAPFDADYRELAARVALQAKAYDAAERHLRALVDIEPDREIHKRRLEALERVRNR